LNVINLLSEAALTVHYLFQLSQTDVEKVAGKALILAETGEGGKAAASPWALGSNGSHPK